MLCVCVCVRANEDENGIVRVSTYLREKERHQKDGEILKDRQKTIETSGVLGQRNTTRS